MTHHRNKSFPYRRDGTLKTRFRVLKYCIEYSERNGGNSPTTANIGRGLGIDQKLAWRSMQELTELKFVDCSDGNWVIVESNWQPPPLDFI